MKIRCGDERKRGNWRSRCGMREKEEIEKSMWPGEKEQAKEDETDAVDKIIQKCI